MSSRANTQAKYHSQPAIVIKLSTYTLTHTYTQHALHCLPHASTYERDRDRERERERGRKRDSEVESERETRETDHV